MSWTLSAHLLASELDGGLDRRRVPGPIWLIIPANGALSKERKGRTSSSGASCLRTTGRQILMGSGHSPVEHDEAVAQPVRGVDTSCHVRGHLQTPAQRASDADADALRHRSARITRERALGRLAHRIDFKFGCASAIDQLGSSIMQGLERLTFLVVAVAPVAVNRDHGTAGRAAAGRPRQFGIAISIEGQVPHQAGRGTIVDGSNEASD